MDTNVSCVVICAPISYSETLNAMIQDIREIHFDEQLFKIYKNQREISNSHSLKHLQSPETNLTTYKETGITQKPPSKQRKRKFGKWVVFFVF